MCVFHKSLPVDFGEVKQNLQDGNVNHCMIIIAALFICHILHSLDLAHLWTHLGFPSLT